VNSLQTEVSGESTPAVPLPQRTFLEQHAISPVVFGFLSLGLVFLLYQGVGAVATLLIFGLKPTSENVTGLRAATGLGQVFLLLAPAVLLTRLASLTPRQFLRLRPPRIREAVIPLVGIFSLQQILQVYMIFQEKIPMPESLRPVIDDLKHIIEEIYRVLIRSSSIPELLFVLLAVALVPAIAEEVLFRGLVQRSFEAKLGGKKAFVLTGLIFALYHLNPFSFVPLVVLGLYLGFLVYRSNSLWVSVAAHFYNNLFACVAVYLHMDDDFLVTGGAGVLSPSVLVVTFVSFCLVFLISTYYFMLVTKPVSSPQGS